MNFKIVREAEAGIYDVLLPKNDVSERPFMTCPAVEDDKAWFDRPWKTSQLWTTDITSTVSCDCCIGEQWNDVSLGCHELPPFCHDAVSFWLDFTPVHGWWHLGPWITVALGCAWRHMAPSSINDVTWCPERCYCTYCLTSRDGILAIHNISWGHKCLSFRYRVMSHDCLRAINDVRLGPRTMPTWRHEWCHLGPAWGTKSLRP
jgi:hypothetical protein